MCCIGRKNLAGAYFNPVHAARITARVRSRLYRDTIGQEFDIVSFSTDGIKSLVPLKLDFGKKLGQYDFEGFYEGLMVGNGVYSLFSDEDRDPIIKFRGFGRGVDVGMIARAHPTSTNYSWSKDRPLKLKEEKKNFYRGLCRFVPKDKRLSINFDQKRVWERPFRNFADVEKSLIKSKPIHM
jgi:hypothetical protein